MGLLNKLPQGQDARPTSANHHATTTMPFALKELPHQKDEVMQVFL